MPAHFSHLLFAEDALREATPCAEVLLERAGNLFRLGAQGPDIFYHNQRTRPLALRYGSLIHRRGFGTLVAHMAATVVATAHRTGAPDMEQAAYLLGFATHAALDRAAHPYIICRAGWVRHQEHATHRYRRCHTLLERLLDVAALRALRAQELEEFDFLPYVSCGEQLPYPTLKMLVKGINSAYPTASFKSRNRRRIENAYADSMRFYRLTDHRNLRLRNRAVELDRRDEFRHRRCAVFHFSDLGSDLDPANLSHRPWPHPCNPEVVSDESYLDLMAGARATLVPGLRHLLAVLGLPAPDDTGCAPSDAGDPEPVRSFRDTEDDESRRTGIVRQPGFSDQAAVDRCAELASLFGDQSLSTTLHGESCMPIHCDPLPLPELFERLYRESGAAACAAHE